MTRPSVLRGVSLLFAAHLGFGGCGPGADSLVVAAPPGRIADLETFFAPAFEAATGVRIVAVGLRSADQAARVRVEAGNPSLDALWIDAGEAALLASEGLLEGPEAVGFPDLDLVDPGAWIHDGALPATFASPVGFLYNTDALSEPPASWAALEAPGLEGQLALFGFGSTLGGLTVAALARAESGDERDADAGFRRLQRLAGQAAVFGTSGPANNQLVAQGEAWVTLGLPAQARELARSDAPVGWTAPAEGAIALPQGVQVVAGGRNVGLARAFAASMFSLEAQETAARELLLIPSRLDAALPEGLPAPAGVLRFDMAALGRVRAAWAQRFRREILPQ